MEYVILSSRQYSDCPPSDDMLVKQIQAKIKDGYELHGGPFMETHGQYPATYQAMIKRQQYVYSIVGSDEVKELQRLANIEMGQDLEKIANQSTQSELTALRLVVNDLAEALGQYKNVVISVNRSDKWQPDIADYGKIARDTLERHAKTIGECK